MPNPRKPKPPLCCPACGYNLTGSCTVQTPTGNCPECGLAFARKTLIEQRRKRKNVYSGGFLTKLLVMPFAIAFLPVCCGTGAVGLVEGQGPGTATGMFVICVGLGIPLLAALFAGWLLAYQYHEATTLGIPIENRRGMQRHIILPWILFFIVELILSAVYFAGGCAIAVIIFVSTY